MDCKPSQIEHYHGVFQRESTGPTLPNSKGKYKKTVFQNIEKTHVLGIVYKPVVHMLLIHLNVSIH